MVRFLVGFFLAAIALAFLAFGGAWMIVPSQERRFATSVYSFELVPGWTCDRQDTEYVCNIGSPPFDAIIVAAMKYRAADDTLEAYMNHLRGLVTEDQGVRLISLRREFISGKEWVEGVLMNSEVRDYETTYLCTTTAEIALLITFSIHKDHRMRSQDLAKMVGSLVVYQRG